MEVAITGVISCPVCKSGITFQSAQTNLTVCSICNSSIERTGDVVSISSLPVLQNKNAAGRVHIGFTGKWKNKTFQITGRIKCDFGHYISDRWTAVFPDGSTVELIDVCGFYAVCGEELEKTSRLQTIKYAQLGTEAVEIIFGRHMYVYDKATCDYIAVEGEVYAHILSGHFKAYELGSGEERVEVLEGSHNVFVVRRLNYITLTELETGLQNSAKANFPNPNSSVGCASCGRSVELKVPAYTTNFVCNFCGVWNTIDIKGRVTVSPKKNNPFSPSLSLGAAGVIDNIEYSITGVTQKNERGSHQIFWREYTLFNYSAGFAFLSEFDGHWIFLKETKDNLPWQSFATEITVKGRNYVLYNQYDFDIWGARGEFFFPADTRNIRAREYISPPEMFIAEKNGDEEITWFAGRHIGSREVFTQFNEGNISLSKSGIGALQPMQFSMDFHLMKKMLLFFFILFTAVQIFLSTRAREKIIYIESFDLSTDSLYAKGISTGPFMLTRRSSNVEFQLQSPVSNSWFEASVTMINDLTGNEYSLQKGVEYYSGYSDGESWSEGSKKESVILSSIPAGKYHLNIFPSFDTGNQNRTFSITVLNDVTMWRNFYIVIFMLAAYPLLQWFRRSRFERQRWNGNSNTPYKTAELDD